MGNFSSFVRALALGLPLLLLACGSEPAKTDTSAANAAVVTPVAGGDAAVAPAMDNSDALPASAAAATPTPASADQLARASGPQLNADVPLRYVVKRGDTLWDIAAYYLKDPWEWPELWYSNSQIPNPHKIYPGEVLELVVVNGHMKLTGQPLPPAAPLEPSVTGKLEPRIRELPLNEAIPAIPIEAIRVFLTSPRIVSKKEMDLAPYLLDFADEHIIGGEHDDIFVRNLPSGADYTYSVVRMGEEYRDPDDKNRVLGYEATPVAEAGLKQNGQPALMTISRSFSEARIGDRLLPSEPELFDANFYPHAPLKAVNGRIISVFNALSQIGQFQVVTLNKGSDQGVDAGAVFSIMQTGRTVSDPYGKHADSKEKLPDRYAGMLMIFKTAPHLSYGLVMKSLRPIYVLDRIVPPKPGQSG